MQTGGEPRASFGQTATVVATAAVALVIAVVVVPPFAQSAGLFEKHVGYATAAAACLIVVVALRWLKALNRQAAEQAEQNAKAARKKSRKR